jgi:hypothetical protein
MLLLLTLQGGMKLFRIQGCRSSEDRDGMPGLHHFKTSKSIHPPIERSSLYISECALHEKSYEISSYSCGTLPQLSTISSQCLSIEGIGPIVDHAEIGKLYGLMLIIVTSK